MAKASKSDQQLKSGDEYSEAETKRRAQAALKRALNTPPKPHKPAEGGKPAAKKKRKG